MPDSFSHDPDEDLFDTADEAHERLADEQAEADIAAGRVISNDAMIKWLKSWGTANPLPPPKCGE